jgi:hypothetical protein
MGKWAAEGIHLSLTGEKLIFAGSRVEPVADKVHVPH